MRLLSSTRCQSAVAQLEQRLSVLDAGVVDEDVQRADLGHAAMDRLGLGDVEGHVPGAELACRTRDSGGVATVEHDVAARLGEAAGQRQPDPAARAGDERGAAGDVEDGMAHGAQEYAHELPQPAHRLVLPGRRRQPHGGDDRGGLPPSRHRRAVRQLRGAPRGARRRRPRRARHGLGRLQLLDPAQGRRRRASRRAREVGVGDRRGQLRGRARRPADRREHRRAGLHDGAADGDRPGGSLARAVRCRRGGARDRRRGGARRRRPDHGGQPRCRPGRRARRAAQWAHARRRRPRVVAEHLPRAGGRRHRRQRDLGRPAPRRRRAARRGSGQPACRDAWSPT